MAKKNTSTNKKKSTSSKAAKTASKPKKTRASRTPPPPEPAQPIRRELAGLLFLCLAIFVGISFFNTEGSVIAFVSNLLKGMIGWGFWLAGPVFLFIALILFFHNGRPVEGRVFAALMLPILFGAMAHMLMGDPAILDSDFALQTGFLFDDGQKLASGGTLGGLLAIGLTKALSVYGAWPVLAVLFLLFLLLALRGNLNLLRRGDDMGYKDLGYARPRDAVTIPDLLDEDEEDAAPALRDARAKDRKKAGTIIRDLTWLVGIAAGAWVIVTIINAFVK